MIPMTLHEIADVGRRRGPRRPRRRHGHRPGLPRQPRARSPAGSSPRSSASTSTATTSPPPRWPPARPRCSAARPVGRPGRGRRRPAGGARGAGPPRARAGCREVHGARRSPAPRARPRPRTCSPRCSPPHAADRRHPRLLQQRARAAADRAARRRVDTRYLLLEMGARGIGHLRDALRDRAARRLARAQRRQGAPRGVRHPGRHRRPPRASSSRRSADDGVAVLNADDPLVAAMARADAGAGR